ncbi:GNAT family N-acetyltransferase [Bacillus weihaiensis]|uniref:GNAT family N-acetyltransferase n=1 Tax=Bacillus weihaiensis TaxID=1547283 RepID=UPI002356C49F|nr:GNAT family N-acetyltransferase [Bacillus weihaiensis]
MKSYNVKAFDLLNNSQYSPTFAYSVVEERIKGQIHYDSLGQAAIIGTSSGIFFLVGDEKNSQVSEILLKLYEEQAMLNKRFTLFSSTSSWDMLILDTLRDNVKQLERYSFTYDSSTNIREKSLPKELSVSKMTSLTMKNSVEFTEEYIKEYWGSFANFHTSGFGYSILHENNSISECVSIFRSNQFAEADIATHSDFQGMGLATYVARLFLQHCVQEELIPRWECDVSNESSIYLARKLGFNNPLRYSIFIRN